MSRCPSWLLEGNKGYRWKHLQDRLKSSPSFSDLCLQTPAPLVPLLAGGYLRWAGTLVGREMLLPWPASIWKPSSALQGPHWLAGSTDKVSRCPVCANGPKSGWRCILLASCYSRELSIAGCCRAAGGGKGAPKQGGCSKLA